MTTTPTATVVQVTLPFPPRKLSPNARVSWQERAPVIKSYRHECRIDAQNVRRDMEQRGVRFPLPGPVNVIVTFVLDDNQNRDWDNMIAAFKAGQDGITAAGIWQDDSIQAIGRIGYEWEPGPKKAVRVRIVGAEG